MILNAMEDKPLPVYGDGQNVRDWIHVEDHCAAVERVLESGKVGEVYNIGGRSERKNLDIVKTILHALGKPDSLIKFVADRPGHDRRYAIDDRKIEHQLGWVRARNLDEGLAATIEWYRSHDGWVQKVRSGEYRNWYEKNYGARE
jgi:dTDP-glucose 4,6-dehydratase